MLMAEMGFFGDVGLHSRQRLFCFEHQERKRHEHRSLIHIPKPLYIFCRVAEIYDLATFFEGYNEDARNTVVYFRDIV